MTPTLPWVECPKCGVIFEEVLCEYCAGVLAHPEDAPGDDPFAQLPPTDADEPPWKGWYSCEDCNGWFCGQPTCYENGDEVCNGCAFCRSHAEDAPEGPKIICLCGSSRFVDTMAVMAWEFEKEGWITMGLHLLPGWYTDNAGHQAEHEGIAEKMDALHLRKIDLANEVFVVNVGGYYGDSTAREIEYARGRGKPVRFLEDKITREPPAEVEDAPEGPWEVRTLDSFCCVRGKPGEHECQIDCLTESQAIAVRDALNHEVRDKGGKTE